MSEVGPVILSSAGLDAKSKTGAPFAVHWKRALCSISFVYPYCILSISLVYSSRLQWHFGFRTRMLSLLVARWPGSRSASLCFVAWLEFGTPWHLACCPGRQPGHRLFFEVRSIGKQMVGWQLREDRLCLGDFCQLLLFLAANDKGDSDKSLVQPCHRSQP